MDWLSFWLGVAAGFCIVLGLPWLLVIVYEAYERIMKKLKGGERLKVKETSHLYWISEGRGSDGKLYTIKDVLSKLYESIQYIPRKEIKDRADGIEKSVKQGKGKYLLIELTSVEVEE
jgi:hypothetical protein